jgi:hypothetical protein
MQSLDLLGLQRDRCIAPTEADIRMMAHLIAMMRTGALKGPWKRGSTPLALARARAARRHRGDLLAEELQAQPTTHNRAVGYSYETVKIFCDKNGKVTRVPYQEHVPPDVTACIFWLKNRKPSEWRDVQQMEHVLGTYIISEKPMTEEEWIKARAIDVTPKDEEQSK